MRKTINTSVVGLAHYGFRSNISKLIDSGVPLALRAEPENIYDENAVAVYVGQVKIGHIRRGEAKQVSAALKSGAEVSVHVSDLLSGKNISYFPVRVRVERSLEGGRRLVADAGVAGIYKITCVTTGSYYIGQSLDVSLRIKDHFDSLSLGVHSNSGLQRIWQDFGGDSFVAELVERVPIEFSGLERQTWLSEKERLYIGLGKKSGLCVNKFPGGLVVTQELRALEGVSEKELRHKENSEVALRRESLNKSIKALGVDIDSFEAARGVKLEEIKNIQDGIRARSGLRSFFNGGMKPSDRLMRERRIYSLKKEVERLDVEIGNMVHRRDAFSLELAGLKFRSISFD